MARRFGYSRVSTSDQDWSLQLEALTKAGVDARDIFREKASGANRQRALPVRSGRLLAEDVTGVHACLGQGLQLKRPVLIRGGDARVAEPASHGAKTSVRNVSVFARAFCTSSAF